MTIATSRRLVLITEGDAHTVEYFHHNGVYPGVVVFSPTKFKELLPYLSNKDDVLVVIKGLTDFNLSEIYTLLDDLLDIEERLYAVNVVSNVDLGVTPLPYFFYEGDLFYGNYQKVRGGKYLEHITPEGVVTKKDKKAQGKKSGNNTLVNPVMTRYKAYKRSSERLVIYGADTQKSKLQLEDNDDFLKDRIANIDAFEEVKPLQRGRGRG